MELVAMVITMVIIYWLSGLNWVFWAILVIGIFVWLCGKAVLNSRSDIAEGSGTAKVFNFWLNVYNYATWIYIIICVVAIGYIIFYE